MREIKFRAWANHTKSMLNMDELLSDGVLKFCLKHKDTFQIMQYTGLKDINGKEIYEGDIVGRLHNGEFARNGSVFYNYKYGRFEVRINGEIDFESGDYSDRDVIGNIYENPDLLDK